MFPRLPACPVFVADRVRFRSALLFFFLIGALAPIIQWVVHKKWRFPILKYLKCVCLSCLPLSLVRR